MDTNSTQRIMLINPWDYAYEGKVTKSLSQAYLQMPYNVVLLASRLESKGLPVCFVDLFPVLIKGQGKVEVCFSLLQEKIDAFRPDVIGITFTTKQVMEANRILEHCRNHAVSNNLEITFVAGGIHATVEPMFTLSVMKFDYVFMGEAENGIVDIGRGVPFEEIKGVTSLKSYDSSKKCFGEIVEDLDSLPFVDYSLCDLDFYTAPVFGESPPKKTLYSIIARGCVNRCGFCAYQRSKVRFRSVQHVIDEIKHTRKQYHFDRLRFLDSSIGMNRKLLLELCDNIKTQINDPDFEWYASIRSDQVDEELLRAMQESGCRHLFYGFESGSPSTLKLMNKGCTVEQNKKVLKLHKKLNFPLSVYMILGYPGETEDDIKLTIKFIKENNTPDRYVVQWFKPWPGSESYNTIFSNSGKDDLAQFKQIGDSISGENVYANIGPGRFKQYFDHIDKYVRRRNSPSPKYRMMNLFDMQLEAENRNKINVLLIYDESIDEVFGNDFHRLDAHVRKKVKVIHCKIDKLDSVFEKRSFTDRLKSRLFDQNYASIDWIHSSDGLILIASNRYKEILVQIREKYGFENDIFIYDGSHSLSN